MPVRTGKLTREIYQKPTHANRYVQFDSHHLSTGKAGIVQGLAERAVRVSSSDAERDAELGRISSVMVCNSRGVRRNLLRGVAPPPPIAIIATHQNEICC